MEITKSRGEQKEENRGIGKRNAAQDVWELVRVLLISLVIVLPIRYFIVQPFIVRGASMESAFEDGEYLIVDELSYYFREPARGDAVIFRYPQDPRQFFIKRIIGLPGERIEIQNGRVRVSRRDEASRGFVLEEPYLPAFHKGTFPDIDAELADNEYFMLGDNRSASSDSRFWGALKRELIVGRALFRAWPIARFGLIEN